MMQHIDLTALGISTEHFHELDCFVPREFVNALAFLSGRDFYDDPFSDGWRR